MPGESSADGSSASDSTFRRDRFVRDPLTAPSDARLVVAARACRRLLATGAHLLHGAAVCAFVFPRLSSEARHGRVLGWAAKLLQVLDVRLEVQGASVARPALLVANHVSWLDIVALLAVEPMCFVSKSDVRRWPLVGFLAASAGTLFIERAVRRDALRVVLAVADVLRDGGIAALFPEGTTGSGRRVLPFHAGLLEAAFAAGVPVQPVALRFSDRRSAFSAAAEFVGTTTLVASLWRIACAEDLVARVTLLPSIHGADHDRRSLARTVRTSIQRVLDDG